jgi:hypothetical protein
MELKTISRAKLALFLCLAAGIGMAGAGLAAAAATGAPRVMENLVGGLLALLNSGLGLLIKKNSSSLEFRQFLLRLVLGGVRTLGFLGVIVLVWKFSGLHVFALTLSIIIPYFTLLLVELAVYYRESKKNLPKPGIII